MLLLILLQAEPLVIDLKDLFQLIFNMRKKEQEAAQKVLEMVLFKSMYTLELCLSLNVGFGFVPFGSVISMLIENRIEIK